MPTTILKHPAFGMGLNPGQAVHAIVPHCPAAGARIEAIPKHLSSQNCSHYTRENRRSLIVVGLNNADAGDLAAPPNTYWARALIRAESVAGNSASNSAMRRGVSEKQSRSATAL